MRIPADHFLLFYNLLLEKFISENLVTSVSDEDKNNGNVWEYKTSNAGKTKHEKAAITLFDLNNTQYFFKKKEFVEKHRPATESLNNRSFYKALLYIGLRFTSDISEYQQLPEVKQSKVFAELLYKEFVRKYAPQEDAYMAEQDTNGVKLFTRPDDIIEFNFVEQLIHAFFKAIDDNKYAEAWQLMSESFKTKNSWAGDFEKFSNSFHVRRPLYDTSKYINIIFGRTSIVDTPISKDLNKDIALLDFTYRHQRVCVTVCYWESLMMFDLMELYKLNEDYENSNRRLAGYEMTELADDVIHSFFGPYSEKYKAKALANPFFVAYIMMISKNHRMVDYLSTPQEVTAYANKRVDCKFLNGKWEIDNIFDFDPRTPEEKFICSESERLLFF